jgi:hypothetical protein
MTKVLVRTTCSLLDAEILLYLASKVVRGWYEIGEAMECSGPMLKIT